MTTTHLDVVLGEALEDVMKQRHPGHAGAGLPLHTMATHPAWGTL